MKINSTLEVERKEVLCAACLSLLMPGLGQIYLKRFSIGLVWFGVFLFALGLSSGRLLPIIAFVSAWETLPKGREGRIHWLKGERDFWKRRGLRFSLFLLVGLIGFVFLGV